MKKWSIIFIFILAITVCIAAFEKSSFTSGNEKVVYNMNPDNSKKVVGSKSFDATAFRLISKSLEDILKNTDLIFVGTVDSDGVTTQEDIPFPNEEAKEMMLKKNPNMDTAYDITFTNIKIERILFGDKPASKTITLGQPGKAGNDSCETKVKKGDRMLFMVRKISQDKYGTADSENALFLIDNNSKLTSLSDNITVAKYDGLDLKVLENDLKTAVKGFKNLNK
ncbi:MAG TPA: hypothetical protein VF941_17855 [Clostridia bacterium]